MRYVKKDSVKKDSIANAKMLRSYQHFLFSVILIFMCDENPFQNEKILMVSGCRLDNITNLIYVNESNRSKEIEISEDIENFQTIIYKCNPGYILKGPTRNICINGNWFGNHPKCLIGECPRATIKSVSFESTCEFNDEEISCDEPIYPGTKVKLSCNSGYRWPKQEIKDILTCNDNGKWDFNPVRCEAICGTESTEAIPFLLGGEKINNSLVPWNVAIYKIWNGKHLHFCGGIILSEKIVLSTAHCFWNTDTGKILDKSHFIVAAGKYYRDYDTREPLLTQFLDISEIHVPSDYLDVTTYYHNNVGIVVVNGYIEYKFYIKPICLEWLDEQDIKSGIEGLTAGWLAGQNHVSKPELRILELITLSQEDCVKQIRNVQLPYVTSDKFCVRPENDGPVCLAETSSGFFIPKIIDGVTTYFLIGFVSSVLTVNEECTGYHLTVITNIQYHKTFIKENLEKHAL